MAEAPASATKEFGEGDSLAEGMWDVLEKMEGRESMGQDRKRQQLAVVRNLPADTDMNLRAHAMMFNFSRENIAGALFEEMVKADREICPEADFKLSEEILMAMENVDRFGLTKSRIGGLKHPDILIFNREGEIVKAIEVKNRTKLSSTNIKQVRGFRSALVEAIHNLKSMSIKTLGRHGLKILATDVGRLRISPRFVVGVVVPLDTYVEERQRKWLEVYKSPFSKSELDILTNYIVDTLGLKQSAYSPMV